jgi:hypothetical protein
MVSDGTAEPHPTSFEPIPATLRFLVNVKAYPVTVNQLENE